MGAWASQPSSLVKFSHPPTLDAFKGSTGNHEDGGSTSGLSHSLSLMRRVTAARETAARAMETVLPASAWASSFPDPESGLEDSESVSDSGEPALRRGRTPAPSVAASAAPSFVPSSLSAAGRLAGVRTPLDELRGRSRSRGRTPPRCRLRLASHDGSSNSDGPSSPNLSRSGTPSRPGNSLGQGRQTAGAGLSGPARSATPVRSPSPARSPVPGQLWSDHERTSHFRQRSSSPLHFVHKADLKPAGPWALGGTARPGPSSIWFAESPHSESYNDTSLSGGDSEACESNIISASTPSQELVLYQPHLLSRLPVSTAWVAEGTPPVTTSVPPLLSDTVPDGGELGEGGKAKLNRQKLEQKSNVVSLRKLEQTLARPSRAFGRRSIDLLQAKGISLTPPPSNGVAERGLNRRPASSAPPGAWAAEMHLADQANGPTSWLADNPGWEGSTSPGIGRGSVRRRQPPLLV
jgi:hypothetical protein